MSINNINNPAIIAEAVAAAIEEMKSMTDAEVHMWAGQWAQLALQAQPCLAEGAQHTTHNAIRAYNSLGLQCRRVGQLA